MRREEREIIFLPGLEPARFGKRGGPRKARDEQQGHRDRVVALASHFTQIGQLPVLELCSVGLRTLYQARDFWGRKQCMAFGFERRQLLAPHIGTPARHHDGRVPAQDARRAAKRVEPSKFLLELLVWSLCHGRNARWASPRPAVAPK